MAEYDLRAELMATQHSLLKEYECKLNKEIEENVTILSHLSQHGQVGEWVTHQEIQQALKRQKKNASKLVALQNLNEELLSVAEEQHHQLSVCVLPSSTESEGEAGELDRIGPKKETASAEVVNISWWHAALLRETVFNDVPGKSMLDGCSSPNSSEEGEAGILKDMVDQLPQVPDTTNWK